jgi:DNA mismatch repair protein MLH1
VPDQKQTSIVEYMVSEVVEQQPCQVPSQVDIDEFDVEDVVPLDGSQSQRDWNQVQLISIKELRQAVLDNEHHGLTSMFKNHSFVGCYNTELALIQHKTELFLVHFYELSATFFYQCVLFGFSNFGVVHIDPISIYELVLIGIDQSRAWNEEMIPKEEIAGQITSLLEEKRFMLAEYFCILVSDGYVTGLPVLVNGYVPNMNRIGLFLLGLGNHVDWTSEKECFRDIAMELSEFYAVKIENDGIQQQLEHLVIPAMKSIIGQQDWVEKDLVKKVANLSDLYKIFERC